MRTRVNRHNYGRLKVYFGPMFSGKSDYLHRDWDRARRGGLEVRAYKPAIHTRDGEFSKSRRGNSFPVEIVSSSSDLLDKDLVGVDLVIIDEVQMFDMNLPFVVQRYRFSGISVIVAGLANDAFGNHFGPTLTLVANATEAEKLTAICQVCGYDGAEFTQMIDGQKRPILTLNRDSPIAIESESISYEARCGRCFVSK